MPRARTVDDHPEHITRTSTSAASSRTADETSLIAGMRLPVNGGYTAE